MDENPLHWPVKLRKEEANREEFVRNHYLRFVNGEINILEYVKIMGYRFQGQDFQ